MNGPQEHNDDLTRLQKNAVEASLIGGREILSVYERDEFKVESKSDDSPLTLADRRSHHEILAHLSAESPEIPILSEEGAGIPFSERRRWTRFWLVDPLDGTKEFIKRNGEFTVNVALIEDGRPVIGVVYIPVRDILYYAARGKGAYKHVTASGGVRTESDDAPERLPIVTESEEGTIRVVSSRSHNSEATQRFIEELQSRFRKVETVIAGSSIKICLVAEGEADVYPRFGTTMEWDTAAGHCIAEEAACSVRSTSGAKLSYNKQDLRNPEFIVERES